MRKGKLINIMLIMILMVASLLPASSLVQAESELEPIVKIENERVKQGDSIDLSQHIDELSGLEEGTIIAQYRTESNELMSLFSLSNDQQPDGYFSLYVWGSKIGSENRIQGGENTHVVKESSLLKTGEVHTVAMVVSKEEGYKYFIDGEKVYEDNGAPVKFLNNIEKPNEAKIGKTVRPGANEYPFEGDIAFAEVYGEALTDKEVIEKTQATYAEQLTNEKPENVFVSEPEDIFYPGFMDSKAYRIPALITTKQGTVIAGIDRRVPGGWDSPNDIDSMVRRSFDNGETWEEEGIIVNAYPENGSNIDMALAQDEATERIFLLVTSYPDASGLMGGNSAQGTGYKEIDGQKYLFVTDEEGKEYTIREEGIVYDEENEPSSYMVKPNRDLYKDGEKIDNIFSETSPLKPFKSSYLELFYSDDEGKTWSDPVDINPETKEEYMYFLGTGPGNGIQLTAGENAGRIAFPVYFFNDAYKQASALVYSDDGGETWQRGESPNEGRDVGNGETIGEKDFTEAEHELTESQVVEMPDGQLKLFMRNFSGYARVATSLDGGETWLPEVEIEEGLIAPYSQMSAIRYNGKIDDKEAVIFASANHPSSRVNGTVRVGLIEEDGTYDNGRTKYRFDWKYEQLVKEGHYGYSNVANLNDGLIGLHYEGTGDQEMSFMSFNVDYLKWDKTIEPVAPEVVKFDITSSESSYEAGSRIQALLELDDYAMMMGTKTLTGTIADKTVTFSFVEQDGNKFVFEGEIPEVEVGEHPIVLSLAEDTDVYNNYGKALGKGDEKATLTSTITVGMDIQSIEINEKDIEIRVNQAAMSLTTTITPKEGTSNVTWSSEDESIVSVDDAGNITGLQTGETIIKATVGTTEVSDEITVVVLPDISNLQALIEESATLLKETKKYTASSLQALKEGHDQAVKKMQQATQDKEVQAAYDELKVAIEQLKLIEEKEVVKDEKKDNNEHKTDQTGEALPNTATNNGNILLLGVFVLLVSGLILFNRKKQMN